LVGLWVPGEQERARTVVNAELNAPGLEVMRKFDQLARIDCPTLVSVGALDLITPVAAAARSPTRYQTALSASRWSKESGPLHLEGCARTLLADRQRVSDCREDRVGLCDIVNDSCFAIVCV